MDRDTRETLADLAGRAARCPGWVYRPGMAILPLEGHIETEPIRIVHVVEDLIWLFVPGVAATVGPWCVVSILLSESPLVDLSDPATIGIVANYDNPPDAESVEVARQIVEGLEDDLPF
jgi:hypothetical protein